LEIEYRLYRILQGHIGIPRIYWFGRESGCRALVMELLGPSLEDMFKKCKRIFSVKTVCLLALQMLNLVQYLHSRNLLHRDIKPANFVMGIGQNANRVYIIDFGLSKKYINSAHAHVRYRIGKNLTGTPRYASINNHDGVEQSRRDDLESLGYVFLYFVRGSLPWQGQRAKNKIAKFQLIHHKKVQVSLDELCAGFPPEFKAYLNYCRRLAFEESPDYTYLKALFKKVMISEGFKLDAKFDWMITPAEMQESKTTARQITRQTTRQKNHAPTNLPDATLPVANAHFHTRPNTARKAAVTRTRASSRLQTATSRESRETRETSNQQATLRALHSARGDRSATTLNRRMAKNPSIRHINGMNIHDGRDSRDVA
jgi:casein kinase 1